MSEVLLTTREAAERAHVSQAVIRQWAARHYLPVADRDHRGRPLYRRIHVLLLERAKRRGKPLADAIKALSH